MGLFADSLGNVTGKASLTDTTAATVIAAPTESGTYLSVSFLKAVNADSGTATNVKILFDAAVKGLMVCNANSGEVHSYPNGLDLAPGEALKVQAVTNASKVEVFAVAEIRRG